MRHKRRMACYGTLNNNLMINHPNRSRAKTPASNPKPEEIIEARESANLSQEKAAKLIYSALRTWQHWEGGESRMHPGVWEIVKIKIGNKP